MPTHGSLSKAGKVRAQTPKIEATPRTKKSPRIRYRRNFERIESINYRIDLDSYSLAADSGNIEVKGKYFIQYHLPEGIWKENNGIISMELIESGDSYLVKRLNYSFLSLE